MNGTANANLAPPAGVPLSPLFLSAMLFPASGIVSRRARTKWKKTARLEQES